jgi:flagellar hook-associated protein 3 FlgL
MSRINSTSLRTTQQLSSNQLLSALRRTQKDLAASQRQITTGLLVSRPSDDPSRISSILSLHAVLRVREQNERNLGHAESVLNATDQALSDVTDLAQEAKSLVISQIGVTSNADTRASESVVVDAQLRAVLDTANRVFQGISLFGGRRSTGSGLAFEEFLGGVRYVGAETNLTNDVGLSGVVEINSNGKDVFNALSARVRGSVDLSPGASSGTRLADLNGAQGVGVRGGSVEVVIDGSPVTVDLSDAETLGDVLARVNDAIASVDATAGSLGIVATGLSLTAGAGHTIAVGEVGTGQTAQDLGIELSATAGAVAGVDVDPRLTELTRVSDLGAALDLTGGLKITQGGVTKVADFSSAQTVQDLIQAVERLNLGVRMGINDSGTGLDLVTEVSGLELSVGENGGGTTGEDLGLWTWGLATELGDFRHGAGVSNLEGEDDFTVELHDGRTFNVDIDGAVTVSDVIGAVQAAASGAGLSVGGVGASGTDFNIGLALDGNGLVLEDGTIGGGDFRVRDLGLSLAAQDLGIAAAAGSGGTIAGSDHATVRVESIFTHLMALSAALKNNDSAGIVFAGEGLEGDLERVVRSRAQVGSRSRRMASEQERSSGLKIVEQSMLSDLQDADLTEAITRLTQQRQQLQASLQLGSLNLQLSLLDFLR